MKFSEFWLRELLNINLDSHVILNYITMAGFEVDSVQPVVGSFHGVVVGEIIEWDPHPEDDKLWVTKVSIGSKRLLNIVCDGMYFRQGMKVAVATVGAILPGNFKIQKVEIHGKVSEGILCSYLDLGMPDDRNGFIDFLKRLPLGANVRDYLKLDDNIIKINVTPNRADCLGIIGIARDIAALHKTKLQSPNIDPVVDTIMDIPSIRVEDDTACPRYLGRVLKGIDIKAITPFWMQERLRRSGIRSIDALVDIVNYVLLELGQPMQIFDADRIDGGILVRMAKEGETLVLSNGRKTDLNKDTLVIADQSKILAIAGIFSGKHSTVNEDTKNLLLECAFFNPFSIIGRASHYGFHTEASRRYERGVDPMLQHKAMERATRLLIDICGGEVGPIVDVTNEEALPKRASIILRRSNLDRLIGHHINSWQVSDILYHLGFSVINNQDRWEVIAPSWRFDIAIEEDLVEEVVRIYGYNNIPDKPIKSFLVTGKNRETDLSFNRVKTLLNDKGYQEVITYSFVYPKVQQLIHPGEESLKILNPISSEMSVMRLSLWTGLLETILYNQNRQQNRVRIFEVGLRFIPDVQANLGIRQEMMLAAAICGNRCEEHWDLPHNSIDFYDMKGDLESVLDLTGKLDQIEFRPASIAALHPGQSAEIYLKGERIGFIGVLHPKIGSKLGLQNLTIVFELEWNKISDCLFPRFRQVSRFPVNRRDIAILVPKDIPASDILSECKNIGINQLVGVKLFDVYQGKGVPKGFKSLAIGLILQDTDRTLEEEEISSTVIKCVEALKERFQASLRN